MQVKKLKIALKANALFSFLSGLTLLVFHQWLAEIMNIVNANTLLLIGLGLLFFAGTVFWTATRTEVNPKQIWAIIWQDWIWVAGSALLILSGAFGISTTGYIIIGVVALIVGDFAVLQQRFLRMNS